jgi:hypothetical protein
MVQVLPVRALAASSTVPVGSSGAQTSNGDMGR